MISLTPQTRRRAVALIFVVLLGFTVRALTANFIRAHFDDPSWFQFGSYAVFDRPAQDILDHKQPLFWINDSTRTDRVVYPPGYSLWLAFLYKVSGSRSATTIQAVQVVLDSLSILLIVAIGAMAYRWIVGLVAGVLAALSPLLALAGATPNADAPTSWLVLGGVLFLILAAKKKRIGYAMAAGALLGLACWLRVNPLFLFVVWAIALLVFFRSSWRQGFLFGGAVALATLLVISPVVVRNLTVFYPQVAPTGLGVGWNLWAGIGETDRGKEFGAPCCDAQMIEQDRATMNLPAGAEIGLFYPDGIRRDRERGQKAIAVMKSHPFWYAGVMARRAAGHLKLFGKPVPNLGSAGFNVTGAKCLPARYQAPVLAAPVTVLGMLQSVMRFLILPVMLIGIVIGWRRDWRVTALVLSTIAYYLLTLAIGHSELRYGLPMQALLLVFAGITLTTLIEVLQRRTRKS